MITKGIFLKVILPSKCYFMPKELHPNRQLWVCSSDLYLSFFGMQGFERGSFPLWLNQLSVGRGSFLLDWGYFFSPASKHKRSLQTVLPENLAVFPTLQNSLKAKWFSQGILFLFFLLLTTSTVVPACSIMAISWTSPEPSVLHLRLLRPPWPQLFQG